MAKGNDKKVVRQARKLLLDAFGNLLESHRERKFRSQNDPRRPMARAAFCNANGLNDSNGTHIETGRMLGVSFAHLREYLATTHARNDVPFTASARKVYDGLKELEAFLDKL
jgi:hypothetical protein